MSLVKDAEAYRTGIFWQGQHVRVSALHALGACTINDTGIMTETAGRQTGTEEDSDAFFGLPAGTTRAAVREYLQYRRDIRHAEKRAADYAAGYHAGLTSVVDHRP